MRYLLYLFILVLLSVTAVVAAQLYLNEPLFVRYGEWSASPSLALALATLLLAVVAMLLVLRLALLFLFFPLKISRWRKQRRSERLVQLREDILRQTVYGNRRMLMKQLAALAPMDVLAAWQAAQIAEENNDMATAGQYLQQAAIGKDAAVSTAAKVKLCLRDNRLSEADNLLKNAGAPRTEVFLAKLHYQVSRARNDHISALAAALQLREQSATLFCSLVEESLRAQLQNVSSAGEAAEFWRKHVPAADKKQPTLLALYLTTLWRLGDEKAAGEGLAQAIRQHPHNNDILRVVADFGTQTQREEAFKANEKRASSASEEDVILLKLLATLAEQLQLPGKARLYGQMLATLQKQRNESLSVTNRDYRA